MLAPRTALVCFVLVLHLAQETYQTSTTTTTTMNATAFVTTTWWPATTTDTPCPEEKECILERLEYKITGVRGVPFASHMPKLKVKPPSANATAPVYKLHSVLPEGLSLDASSGRVTGVPRENGTFKANTSITLPRADLSLQTVFLPLLVIEVSEPVSVANAERVALLEAQVGVHFRFQPSLAKNASASDSFSLQGKVPKGVRFNTSTGALAGAPTEGDEEYEDIIILRQSSGGAAVIASINKLTVADEDCNEDDYGPHGEGCFNGGGCNDTVKFDQQFTCSCPIGTVEPNCRNPLTDSSASQEELKLAIGLSTGLVLLVIVLVGYGIWLYMQWRSAQMRVQPEKSEYIPPLVDEWEFDRDRLTLVCPLGEELPSDPLQRTAMLDQMRRFINEANAMKRFDHPHVLRLLGVCLQESPLYVITEFMENGDLHNFLRAHHEVGVKSLTQMAADVSDGLAYLHLQKFVHGDLACRNCLVDANFIVKISDFGMSKDTSYKGYYYRASSQNVPVPVRWMAPECLKFGQYTTPGDLWSLGVLIWELMTHCEMPYPALGNQEVFDKVTAGYRMPRPPLAPQSVYDIMLRCWNASAKRRPEAKDIAIEMEAISKTIRDSPLLQRRVGWDRIRQCMVRSSGRSSEQWSDGSRRTSVTLLETQTTTGTATGTTRVAGSSASRTTSPSPGPLPSRRRKSGSLMAPDMRRPGREDRYIAMQDEEKANEPSYVPLADQDDANARATAYAVPNAPGGVVTPHTNRIAHVVASAIHSTPQYILPGEQVTQQLYPPVGEQANTTPVTYEPLAQGNASAVMYEPVETQHAQTRAQGAVLYRTVDVAEREPDRNAASGHQLLYSAVNDTDAADGEQPAAFNFLPPPAECRVSLLGGGATGEIDAEHGKRGGSHGAVRRVCATGIGPPTAAAAPAVEDRLRDERYISDRDLHGVSVSDRPGNAVGNDMRSEERSSSTARRGLRLSSADV